MRLKDCLGTLLLVLLVASLAVPGCRKKSSSSSAPPPTFEPWDVWASGSYLAGDPILVDRTIDNYGSGAGSCYYSLYLSSNSLITTLDWEIYSGLTAPIASGGSSIIAVTGTIPLSIPTGNYYVGLYLTDSRRGPIQWVATATATVSVLGGGAPSFEAFDVFASGTYAPGDPILVDRIIDNTGTLAAPCDYTLYLSTNNIISALDTPIYVGTSASIAPGGSSIFTPTGVIPVSMANGNYYVGLYITDFFAGTPNWVASPAASVTIGGCGDDLYEPNNGFTTAFDLTLDEAVWLSTIWGSGVANDDDFYVIDVTPGFLNVIVDLRFTHALGDIDVELYDASWFLVDLSDSSTNNEYIDVFVPFSGIYYILVYPFGSACNSYDLWWDDL